MCFISDLRNVKECNLTIHICADFRCAPHPNLLKVQLHSVYKIIRDSYKKKEMSALLRSEWVKKASWRSWHLS